LKTLKQQAAERALEFVRNGITLGLGSGSTTTYFIKMVAEKIRSGSLEAIRAVPTSEATAEFARDLGIPLTTLDTIPELDLAVDGADEVDPQLNLIKGLGRALLREKIVGIHAKEFVIVLDESKVVKRLGTHVALPVEILPFEARAHVRWLGSLGCKAELWLQDDGSPILTDNGNYLARCWFSDGIREPFDLARRLADRPGILEHGLFLNMATRVIVAESEGVKILERNV